MSEPAIRRGVKAHGLVAAPPVEPAGPREADGAPGESEPLLRHVVADDGARPECGESPAGEIEPAWTF